LCRGPASGAHQGHSRQGQQGRCRHGKVNQVRIRAAPPFLPSIIAASRLHSSMQRRCWLLSPVTCLRAHPARSAAL
jgi:hypothetical protein